MRAAYVAALKAAGEAGDDIVGYVFAVNGKLNSAEIYELNGLFRKMWPKLLDASATEAIATATTSTMRRRRSRRRMRFSARPRRRQVNDKPLNFGVRRVTRESDEEVMFETSQADGLVHRSYLAK